MKPKYPKKDKLAYIHSKIQKMWRKGIADIVFEKTPWDKSEKGKKNEPAELEDNSHAS